VGVPFTTLHRKYNKVTQPKTNAKRPIRESLTVLTGDAERQIGVYIKFMDSGYSKTDIFVAK